MDNQSNNKVTLVQFPAMFGLPNVSPFCMKVETFLRMASIPYEVKEEVNTTKAPKKKFPYIIHNGKKIPDSSFVLDYLSEEYCIDFNSHLSIQDQAVSRAFQRLFEENLFWVLAYSRWFEDHNWKVIKEAFFSSLPPILKGFLPNQIKKDLEVKLKAQGIGRHSKEEIYDIGLKDLRAIIDQLGAKPFFMGDRVSQIDATAYAFISNILLPEFQSPLDELSKTAENLKNYCNRMQNLYFPELLAKQEEPEMLGV